MAFTRKGNNANEKVTFDPKLPVEAFIQVITTLSFMEEKQEAARFNSICYSASSNLAYAIEALESAESDEYVKKMEANLESAQNYMRWAMANGREKYLPSNEQLNKIEIKRFGDPDEGPSEEDLITAVELNIQEFAKHVDTPYLDIEDMEAVIKTLPTKLRNTINKTVKERHEANKLIIAKMCETFEKDVDKCINEASEGAINDVDTVSLHKFADWIVNDIEDNVDYCSRQAKIATKKSTKFWSGMAAKSSDVAKRLNRIVNKYSQSLTDVTTDDAIDHAARS